MTLSTTPVWRNGRLEPRPFTLRLFLARVGDGWRVMPGGFVRVADDADARAVSLQRGGAPADAWVLSDKPVAETTLLPAPDRIAITRATGALPSRAAANLFWVARYVERAEATLRLVRALVNRVSRQRRGHHAVVEPTSARCSASGSAVPTELPECQAGARRPRRRCSARDLAGALPYLVGAAQSAASVIRDRFSPDAWRALTDLVELIGAPIDQAPTESAIFERINGGAAHHRVVLRPGAGEHEPARRLALPRARPPDRARDRHLPVRAPVRVRDRARQRARRAAGARRQPDHLSAALRHGGGARRRSIDLVVLDPNNPRSVAYQLGPHRGASRHAAQAQRRQPAVAAGADRDRAGDADPHRRCRRARRCDIRRHGRRR